MGLTDGRGGLRLPEEALAAGQPAIRDEAPHHAGLDLLKVIRLSGDFGLKKADVGLISSLLLRTTREGGGQRGQNRDQSSVFIFILDTNGLDGMTNAVPHR